MAPFFIKKQSKVQITTSPDITTLQIQVTFDISGASPVVSLVNQSVGPNLQNIIYAFSVTSPSGTPIHKGLFSPADVVGIWSSFVITDPWPMPGYQIEWSGAPYIFSVSIMDSVGNIFSAPPQFATICQPNGNTNLSKNFYGVGKMNVRVQCQAGNIFFEDTSNVSYQGQVGTQLSAGLTVVYPIDETNVIPTPFSITNFSTALVPISYSSTNYQYTYNSIYIYPQANNVIIQIRYRSQDPKTGTYAVSFPVLCNIDLSPIVCNLVKLKESLRNGSCDDVQRAEQQVIQITPALFLAFIGIEQPLNGINVPKQIEEIQEITGWDCRCCYMPTGIIPQTGALASGNQGTFMYQIVSQGGDIGGVVNVVGNNIQFILHDKSYIFALSENAITDGFSITPTGTTYSMTYTLDVNIETLATQLVNAIIDNPSLITLLSNNLPGSNANLILDGACIFSSTNTYNYTFILTNAPINGTQIIFNSILSGGMAIGNTFVFTSNTLSVFQTYLNSLGIGTFTVSLGSPAGIVVQSSNNSANLSNLTYTVSGAISVANMIKNSNAVVPVSETYAIQRIIYALCGLTDSGIALSQDFEIPTILNGVSNTILAAQGAPLTQFLLDIIAAQNNIISYTLGLGAVTCQSISPIFQRNTNSIDGNSLIYGFKGTGPDEGCAGMTMLEVFQYMLQAAKSDATTSNLFCSLVSNCTLGQPCVTLTGNAVVTPYDTTCPSIVGIQITIS